jgi:Predicted Fe-S protein
VCRGCKRFNHEVIHWNGYSDTEKNAVLDRLQLLLTQVVKSKIQIVNISVLSAALARHDIRINDYSDPYCWVFDLLKAGAKQIQNIETFGCRVNVEWQSCALTELRDIMDAEFYALSCAHLERYFSH